METLGIALLFALLAILVWAVMIATTPEIDQAWREADDPAWACPVRQVRYSAPEREARAWARRSGVRLSGAPLVVALARHRVASAAGMSRDARQWLMSQWYPAWPGRDRCG